MAPPHRPPPRIFEVVRKRSVTPNMLRVTLGGAGMADFPAGQAGGYVKLRLTDAVGNVVVRTYTIRAQRDGEIDIDFALHADTASGTAGPATEWALAAEHGDQIEVGGPGPAKPLPPGKNFYLLTGDMTALPAISVNLEELDPKARGLAIIEVMSEEDRQELACPDGVKIHWLVVPQPGSRPQALALSARNASVFADDLYAWSASEFSAMRELRELLREKNGLGPERLYISSYWKCGLNEDAHKIAKREDAEAQ